MDIHKPKPVHSWREFLTEIGTIICGILIALALEQAIEAVRHGGEAREARKNTESELVGDVTRVHQRSLNQACIDRRLGELKTLLNKVKPDGAIVPPQSIGNPPRYAIETMRWEAASHSGRVSLFSTEDQSKLGFLYTTLNYFYTMQNAEQLAWARLRTLENTERLTADGLLTMRSNIEEARFYNDSIRQIEPIIFGKARELGVSATSRHDSTPSVCLPMTAPDIAVLGH